jgi:formate dehydrogenase maturation protein FdhE
MLEHVGCATCGTNPDKHGFPHIVDWDGLRFVFCSYLCEFLWRRKRSANQTLGPVASSLPR